ncbi:hypothetical protein [Haloarcula laminariae]|uniref:hypothetical protein n=1 Tax=Haloarcula laminariae TaxID=2961577 RepID=UPI0021CABFAD|nr:hypothetical protein [Halomicroarcula laminariae]
MTDAQPAESERSYDGFPGAFPYALRTSESLLFKGYVVVAVLLSVAIGLIFTFGLIGVLAASTGVRGGTFTFSRTFFFFVGLLVVAPLLAPVLLVARRHRRTASSVAYDRGLALAALGFVASLYVGLIISVPPALQEPTNSGVVLALYGLPQIAGFVPPLLAVGLMYVVHRVLK